MHEDEALAGGGAPDMVRGQRLDGETRARVSVVIPCHNYAQYLEEAVVSALAQEGVEVDVTIVDDASTDDSVKIARRLVDADPRVRLIAREVNLGHIHTFNEALESATAPYVVKLDPDDLLPPGSLSRSVSVLETHPDVVFVYGPVTSFSGQPPTSVRAVGARRLKIWPGRKWLTLRMKRCRNVIYQPEVMIRTSALQTVGGHRAEVPAASDLNLWLRLASQGSVARIGGVVQGFYRQHSLSMQHTVHTGKLVDFRARRDAFDLFFAEAPNTVKGLSDMRVLSRRSLAKDAVRLAFEEHEAGNPAQEYLDDAARLDSRIVRTRAWKINRRRVADPGYNGIPVRLERVRRDLAARIRFRMWRRFGI
ncbi:glycosyltransferase family 2 protein [Microbacterium protaetiae]|nr:glycosyltransferase [Microbacterium protaetiae]